MSVYRLNGSYKYRDGQHLGGFRNLLAPAARTVNSKRDVLVVEVHG